MRICLQTCRGHVLALHIGHSLSSGQFDMPWGFKPALPVLPLKSCMAQYLWLHADMRWAGPARRVGQGARGDRQALSAPGGHPDCLAEGSWVHKGRHGARHRQGRHRAARGHLQLWRPEDHPHFYRHQVNGALACMRDDPERCSTSEATGQHSIKQQPQLQQSVNSRSICKASPIIGANVQQAETIWILPPVLGSCQAMPSWLHTG